MATLASTALICAKQLGRVNAAGTSITDLATEIKAEIGEAIRFYNRQIWALTEARDMTFTTVADQQWYSTVDLTDALAEQSITGRTAVSVADIVSIDWLEIAGCRQRRRRPNEECDGFTVHAGRIGLWPVPAGVSEVMLAGHVKPLVPAVDADTSVWFDQAGEMIQSAAAKRVALKYLRDAERAAEFAALEETARLNFAREHMTRTSTGRIRSHD